jgi:spermidine/putrescine-binding protein
MKLVNRLLCAAVFSTLVATQASAQELNLLTWEGYADPSFVEPFTKQSGCAVSATYVGSGDEFVAKMAAAASTYDLVSPGSDIAMRLVDLGVIEPVDLARVPNAADFSTVFQKPTWLSRDDKTYGVPYSFGIIRIVATPASGLGPNSSIDAFWEPTSKGKVALWDDIETLYMAARRLGYKDVYNLTDEQLAATKASLGELMGNVRKLWFSAGELDNLIQTGEVGIANAWETNLINAWKAGGDLVEITPPEGRGAWSDSWMISMGAGENPCTYAWLDYISSPKAQAMGNAITGFGYSNPKMITELDDQSRKYMQKLGMDDPKVLASVDWWQPVAARPAYLEVWNQVKAAK